MSFIYMATNGTNGKSYVGKSTGTIQSLFGRHKRNARKGAPGAFYGAIRKYGWDVFRWSILFENNVSKKILSVLESEFIKDMNTMIPNGYNMTEGGEGFMGLTRSESHKSKISESIKKLWESEDFRQNHKSVGAIRSDETRSRISKAKLGFKHTEQTKEKLRAAFTGNKRSEAVKIKISNTMKGKIPPGGGLTKILERNVNNIGRTLEEIYGEERAGEIRNKIAEATIIGLSKK